MVDVGVEEYQKFTRGETAVSPDYMYFGSDNSDVVVGDIVDTIASEFLRKQVTWQKQGTASFWTVNLLTTEANALFVNRYGLVTSNNLGSDTLYSNNESIIGGKTSSFSVEVRGEIIITNQ